MDLFNNLMNEKNPKKKTAEKNFKKTSLSDYNFDEEFSEEFIGSNAQYSSNGVSISKRSDDRISITYHGLLAKSGATDVFSVIGYGSNQYWNDVQAHRMNRVGTDTFEVQVPIRNNEPINLAFKDCADHWDNNNGMNYTFNH